MPIIKLQEHTINLIAAGEVVERPASIVKELVENALDAGSSKIDIYLEQAGKNFISVSDNGMGMTSEDLQLAVQRHTTSKLNEGDLFDIQFFGFRGEALPSIASVSNLRITSKSQGKDEAFCLSALGEQSTLSPAVHEVGTKVQVQDLFFTVPARLKFLKSDSRELAACLDVIKRLAVVNPNVSFTVRHGNNNILKLPSTESLRSRVIDVLGQDFEKFALELDSTEEEIKVYGYAASPNFHKATSEQQFIFVNGRPVRDRFLSGCVKAAYQDHITAGRFAPTAILIDIPNQLVDVNVHPSKSEVRFHDIGLVRSIVVSAIKKAIGNNVSVIQNFSLDNYVPFQESFADAPIIRTNLSAQESHKSYSAPTHHDQKPVGNVQHGFSFNTYSKPEPMPWLTKPQNVPHEALGQVKAQIHNAYIVAQNQAGMVLVDQHAAHERIVYEQVKALLKGNDFPRQKLLLPEIVRLPSEVSGADLEQIANCLLKLGVVFEKIDATQLKITEAPSILTDKGDLAKIIEESILEMLNEEQVLSIEKIIDKILATYACHHSIRSGQELSLHQMNLLLRQIEETKGSGQCCHGRPVYVQLSRNDIDKLFERR